MKFFLYAKTPDQADDLLGGGGSGDLFLVQLLLQSSSGDMTVSVKSSTSDPALLARLLSVLRRGLAAFSPN